MEFFASQGQEGLSMDEAVRRANAVIQSFGDYSRKFFQGERRDELTSVLFDVPRRSLIGWDGIYQHGPDFLREITSDTSPEDIGREMRRLGGRPYQLQLAILLLGYLGAREQRRLNAELPAGDPPPGEDPADTVEFVLICERIARAYRGDGTFLPEEAGGRTRVVGSDVLADVRGLMVPIGQAPIEAIRRAGATLNMYAFLFHGEQRDGTFGHGPYEGPEDTTLLFREVNDLQNDYLPWAAGPGNPFPNLVLAYACRGVEVRCDLYGSLVTQPYDIADHVTHVAAVTVGRDGSPHPLSEDELESATEAAQAGVKAMYGDMAAWEPRYKLDYGRALFANHLKPFPDLLELDEDWGDRLMTMFESLEGDLIDRLYVDDEPPSVWAHMVHGESACFAPVTV